MHYFELKRSLRKKERPMLKFANASGEKRARTVRFESTPPTGSSDPSRPLSPGIPLTRSHPTTAPTNYLTYDPISQVWPSR